MKNETPKVYGHSPGQPKSPRLLPKTKFTLLLKLFAASCVMGSVGAASPPFITPLDLAAAIADLRAELRAEFKAEVQDVRQCSGVTDATGPLYFHVTTEAHDQNQWGRCSILRLAFYNAANDQQWMEESGFVPRSDSFQPFEWTGGDGSTLVVTAGGRLELSGFGCWGAGIHTRNTKATFTVNNCGKATGVGMCLIKADAASIGSAVKVQTSGKAFGSNSLGKAYGKTWCTNSGAGKAPRSASGIHCWDNLNDGLYGNSHSWIGGIDGAKAGVVLPATRTIVGIQLARDLGGAGYSDRAGGMITVEYSATAKNNMNPWEGSTGWISAGSISGWAANTPNYYLFSTPVEADGLRITVAEGRTCVDELEIFATA